MNRDARLNLGQLISDARELYNESQPHTAERRPRTCPKCGTVGSLVTHEDLVFHEKQGDKLVERTVLGACECLFCHYVKDRV